MLDVVLAVPFWLEMAATLTGGLSGAMSAVRARYDIFGVVCIAIVTGLAGGIMRDLLLQNYGIYAFQRPTLILACAVAGVVVFYFGKLATYLDPVVDLLDNLSVALWAVISVGKGLSAGLDVVPAIILGTITAVGGGILRDIAMNHEPNAFQAGALYGSAALIGSTAYALMAQNHILDSYAPATCAVLVIGIRYASLFFGWSTKPPKDYSDVVTSVVTRPVKSVARRVRPPKGKIERDKERNRAYARLKYVWARLNGEIPPPRKRRELEAARRADAGTDAGAGAGSGTRAETGSHAQSRTRGSATVAAATVTDASAAATGRADEGARTNAGADAASDPSDRIIVSREELHRILEASAGADPADADSTPRDPFEPRL